MQDILYATYSLKLPTGVTETRFNQRIFPYNGVYTINSFPLY